ncbi:saccharopine dehydrogenase family protein [Pontixanthobacter aquaemixtae]|uniref:Saccharopine dehydrogenase n=1 Tax=Pontixanthobacter aquaemixtae TaxID=1958940 RepID=A0A844ZRZ0_9SPHN|nr:saccharopine dehydrogenase NADP-binding domain-containing protein [Pontixanthobacter aquaemixtae]MXO90615.1 saccharopine dehydrogenase [Pontixanthobacter aquaemixtae]
MIEKGQALKVLIVGGSGVFGSRLAKLAEQIEGVHLTLAGRNLARLEAVAGSLASRVSLRQLDRNAIDASDLAGFDVVVDSAGPFQASHSKVIEAAIAAGVNYIDLADGRDFVASFPRYDQAAKEAGIAMVTGASSIPALSHAVIDHLTLTWRQIDTIRIGIFPGNRAPRGRSVVEAILSYVGKPVRVFHEGRWGEVPGWGMTHREDIPGIGKRWASVCDTPEQDLLVKRYAPTRSAEFFAGLELGFLHLGLAGLSQLVRFKLLPGLRPFAGPMLWVAQRFLAFGSDRGAMTVRVSGVDGKGHAQTRSWVLNADANRGPNVPVLAAVALIRRLARGETLPEGASACSGMLSLEDFSDLFAQLEITTTTYLSQAHAAR